MHRADLSYLMTAYNIDLRFELNQERRKNVLSGKEKKRKKGAGKQIAAKTPKKTAKACLRSLPMFPRFLDMLQAQQIPDRSIHFLDLLQPCSAPKM